MSSLCDRLSYPYKYDRKVTRGFVKAAGNSPEGVDSVVAVVCYKSDLPYGMEDLVYLLGESEEGWHCLVVTSKQARQEEVLRHNITALERIGIHLRLDYNSRVQVLPEMLKDPCELFPFLRPTSDSCVSMDKFLVEHKFADTVRIEAAVAGSIMLQTYAHGNTCVSRKTMDRQIEKLLGGSLYLAYRGMVDDVGYDFSHCCVRVDPDGKYVTMPHFYEAERLIFDRFSGDASSVVVSRPPPLVGAESLDALQREAVIGALTRPTFLITGGPGTGKSTVVKSIVDSSLSSVLLLAPTGIARKNLQDKAGFPASTVHRWLCDPARESPELCIVDEATMLDSVLLGDLLDALGAGTRVVLVGDKDQLPSVDPGSPFSDLLSSGHVSVELKKVYRQESGSSILDLSKKVRGGVLLKSPLVSTKDVEFIVAPSARLPGLVHERMQRDTPEEIVQSHVISPGYNGYSGVSALNNHSGISGIVRSSAQEVFGLHGGSAPGYRCFGGDKVVITKNDSGVANGDIFFVVAHSEQTRDRGKVAVYDIDGRRQLIASKAFSNQSKAYATSVHKSQGSEFSTVYFVVGDDTPRLLQYRKLFYTGITRAKNKLVIACSSASTLNRFISEAGSVRKTCLLLWYVRRASSSLGQGKPVIPSL